MLFRSVEWNRTLDPSWTVLMKQNFACTTRTRGWPKKIPNDTAPIDALRRAIVTSMKTCTYCLLGGDIGFRSSISRHGIASIVDHSRYDCDCFNVSFLFSPLVPVFYLYRSYKLGPRDVIKFCTECVLSEEGECDLPDGFYDANQLTP